MRMLLRLNVCQSTSTTTRRIALELEIITMEEGILASGGCCSTADAHPHTDPAISVPALASATISWAVITKSNPTQSADARARALIACCEIVTSAICCKYVNTWKYSHRAVLYLISKTTLKRKPAAAAIGATGFLLLLTRSARATKEIDRDADAKTAGAIWCREKWVKSVENVWANRIAIAASVICRRRYSILTAAVTRAWKRLLQGSLERGTVRVKSLTKSVSMPTSLLSKTSSAEGPDSLDPS